MPDTLPKLLERSTLAEKLLPLREAGKTVVLCNGVFDLLHVGHTRVLAAAAAKGDVLVVAINDDASARMHKGSGRPIHPAIERAEILSALSCVDWICMFSEETVAATLQAIQPNIHAKGEDYDPERIPSDEQLVAEELGIQLALVGGPKVNSSSQIADSLEQGRAS
ncbi:MAG TPA: adenylyltransferase/cytidyltransferase family protein [Planctomycetota bacterium]|jgi:D-beta-D-heptose 7-phosphate kinase/D-beta-D-heptose 1-phosphate adenosyltransferase|nr:adenylyltransferase/cytidyltransferase family protein [Planctomycetota bacterium]MDP7245412.1 adenylyltransferase/cytidyltransferase family protein [Planctomycetota bacterium]MDP7560603.1 adenylyltransferase/cytidyltransferase family protein [Planctomycetota bacterium]HJM39176.1 adenylyltransferase/cytidyltransferase family protein [Planctomycetota bacterium]|tara:strand:- start:62595 stop:63092 length:498 start_codon:yes stop_codon:yes gene_type:complete